jgi:hypothetical protein
MGHQYGGDVMQVCTDSSGSCFKRSRTSPTRIVAFILGWPSFPLTDLRAFFLAEFHGILTFNGGRSGTMISTLCWWAATIWQQ